MAALIISDLHLSENHPELSAAFLSFLEQDASSVSQLFILGDLFEYWLGDDNKSIFNLSIINALRKLSDIGIQVFVMPGNRDFMLGRKFAYDSGCSLLSDPTCLDLYGTEVLLMHGDSLCTHDKSYQRFRKIIRHPMTKWILAHLPINVRKRIAGDLRQQSADANTKKTYEIMDVNEAAVKQVFDEYNVTTLIHGHTHRFAHHSYEKFNRYVLGDWGTTLSYIFINEDGISLESRTI